MKNKNKITYYNEWIDGLFGKNKIERSLAVLKLLKDLYDSNQYRVSNTIYTNLPCLAYEDDIKRIELEFNNPEYKHSININILYDNGYIRTSNIYMRTSNIYTLCDNDDILNYKQYVNDTIDSMLDYNNKNNSNHKKWVNDAKDLESSDFKTDIDFYELF